MVEPYEDYLTVRETRFFFLRIPYSIIAELHKKAFSDLRQPTSEARTNALIDSVGFDFIQPPNVDCRYVADNKYLEVEILAFESEAFAASPSEENIADLAMILVDSAYDGEVFSLSAVHFAEDLEHNHWRFRIPRTKVGKQVMLIYIDLYGNEHREVRPVESFQAPESGGSSTQAHSEKSISGSVSAAGRSRTPRTAASRVGSGTSSEQHRLSATARSASSPTEHSSHVAEE